MVIDLIFKGEKATYQFASALGKFGVELVNALKDGFQPIQDVAAIGSAAVADLLPVAGLVSQMSTELEENKLAFLHSWQKAGEEFYEALLATNAKK